MYNIKDRLLESIWYD